MLNRRQLLIATALAPAAAQAFTPPKYAAGRNYLLLRTPASTPTDHIEVVEFFAYTCPHCLQFVPYMNTWKKHLPENVSVRVCPVAWTPDFLPFTQTYFALEQLGELPRLHLPFFESVIYQERSYSPQSAENDILGFMKDNGIDPDHWNRAMKSFSVQNKTRLSTQTWQAYGIDSTPMLGVAGRFPTGPHLAGSREETLELVNWLIDEVRQTRQ